MDIDTAGMSFTKSGLLEIRQERPMTPVYVPLDLQINTLLRLPVKSLLRFRCVSKLWSSIITSRDFRNQHLKIGASSAPPRLLIAFVEPYGEKVLVVSSPNPNAPSFSSCSYRDLSLVKNIKGNMMYNACRGLICVGTGFKDVGIYNHSTRQLHTFPQFKFKKGPEVFPRPNYMLGYDPVEDQYKVLAVDAFSDQRLEHKVVTLGGEEAWREAPCVACPHIVSTRGLYMNGTLYYEASRKYLDYQNTIYIIVSFDVMLETFNIIKVPSKVLTLGMWFPYPWVDTSESDNDTDKTLINYRGKIGVVENPRLKGSFRMWVVEDAEKEEWSMSTFHLPESAAAGLDFLVMDTFSNGEICLVPKELSDPFCLYYYNLEKKSMRSVRIEGLPVSEFKRAERLSLTISDHYESLMFSET
ncbi:putative F-box protein At3g47150 [Eutrema salsugineum]|uniref:putative F-box protein At3g47150 n=1 Tax=Eutrema salsugineum TaxID=72664 RepID=UPI000CED2C5A|nr:putative F-box protein At3g47150 [Eutrema salsugineum]